MWTLSPLLCSLPSESAGWSTSSSSSATEFIGTGRTRAVHRSGSFLGFEGVLIKDLAGGI